MTNRAEILYELCSTGATYDEIAERLGVSRQRAHQLVAKQPELRQLRDDVAGYDASERKQNKNLKQHLTRQRKYAGMPRAEFYADPLKRAQQYKLNAKRGNSVRDKLHFNLQHGDLVWPTTCPVLGIPLDYAASAGSRAENSASFDRINPDVGYTADNTRIISWRANRIKNDGTAEEHLKIAKWMQENC